MRKIFLFILCLMPLMIFGQSQNVRHVITPDGEITFWRGQQQLFVRAYTGEPIYQADYYVATNGSDSNDGTTIETPFKTFAKAESVMVAGDTLMVRTGTYNEYIRFNTASGTAEYPIVIMNYGSEIPIIDGMGTLPGDATALVRFDYEYNIFSGITVRNSDASGVIMYGTHNIAKNLTVYNVQASGIGAYGDTVIVEDCHVYSCSMGNYEGGSPSGWSSGISAARGGYGVDDTTHYAILRRNIVHDNWGEGLSAFEARNILFEDNIIYNNWSVNLYISDAADVLCQRNLIYMTKAFTGPTEWNWAGISVNDEVFLPESKNVTIVNNIVYGCYVNFLLSAHPHTDLLVANNTFVNGYYNVVGCVWIKGDAASYTNCSFIDNIVVQENSYPVIYFTYPDEQDIAWSYNLWSKTPSVYAQGTGDVIGDPLFTKTGSILPGILTGHYFDLGVGSPAINAADDIDLADDYFKDTRDNTPNTGAIEGLLGLSTLLNGLISVWELDETTGDAIDLHGTNDGTVSVTTQGASGKIGTAYAFDGINDYIELTPTASGTSFTIAKWVYRDATQTDDYGDLFTNADGSVGLFLGKTGYLNYYLTHNHLSSSTVTASTWTHVVISVTSGVGTLYINGIGSGIVDHSISTFNYKRIGYYGAEPYKGSIDAVRFWNRGLTQGEITELYTKENAVTTYPW